jgi:dihydrofolate reductase
MTIKAILAMDLINGIGKNGTIPWAKNKADLQWFKEQTNGHIVVMGSNTWLDPAMPKPLSNRYNIVVSNQKLIHSDTRLNAVIKRETIVSVLSSIEKDVWIIGGAKLFEITLPIIQEIYVSKIKNIYDCDTKFVIPKKEFILKEAHQYYDKTLFIDIYKRAQ